MVRYYLYFLMAFCAASVGVVPLFADFSLLRQVSEAHRTNWEYVQSWRGNVEILDETTSPAVGMEDAKWWSKVSFAYQSSPHAVRWNWQMTESENAKIHTPISNGLIKDGTVTVLEVNKIDGEAEAQRSVRILDLKPFELGPYVQVFSPMYYVGYRGDNVADWFDHVRREAETADAAELKGWEVSRDGDRVILSFESPSLLNRYTADLSKGGNLISFEAEEREDSVVVSKGNWDWQYEQQDRIWLPTNLTFSTIEFARAGEDIEKGTEKSKRVRTISWKTTELNSSLVDEFTLEAIGIEKGDDISNTTTGAVLHSRSSQEPTAHSRSCND